MKHLITLVLYFIGGVIFCKLRLKNSECYEVFYDLLYGIVSRNDEDLFKMYRKTCKIASIFWPLGLICDLVSMVIAKLTSEEVE